MNTQDRTRRVAATIAAQWGIPFDLVLKNGTVVVATATPAVNGKADIHYGDTAIRVAGTYQLTLHVPAFDAPLSEGGPVAPVAAPAPVVLTEMEAEKDARIRATADRFMGRTAGPTEKQLGFLNRLLAERPAFQDVENLWPDVVARMSRGDVSKLIDRILAEVPRETTLTRLDEETAKVPDGRYAVEHDGTLKFYRVNTPTEGRWAGRTFVEVQASDDLHPVRDHTYKTGVLEAIAADPRAASLRYGQHIGSCGVCGRTLTDEASRAAGIGPVCASKTGW